MSSTKRFSLGYFVVNAGDGSAYAKFAPGLEQAEEMERIDGEECGEGWGEPSASAVELRINGDVIEYLESAFMGGKIVEVWHPVQRSSRRGA